MSDLERGDVVSLSRAQTSTVSIDAVVVGQDYTVTLPINGVGRPFTHQAVVGDTTGSIADALEVVLLRDQTFYSVAVGLLPNQLTIVGPLGFAFVVLVVANMTAALFEAAVDAQDEDGESIGRLRVLEAESTSEKLRSYATRSAAGQVLELEDVLLKEVDGGRTFEVHRDQILTVIEKVGNP